MRIAIDLDGPIAQHGDAKDWWNHDHWPDLVPTEGALEGLQQLAYDHHFLAIVTARPFHDSTYQWLGKHGFGAYRIEHTPRKWEVPSHVYLDDSVGVLQSLADRRLTAVKWVTRSNTGARANFAIESWPEFVQLIRSGRCHGKLRRRPRVLR